MAPEPDEAPPIQVCEGPSCEGNDATPLGCCQKKLCTHRRFKCMQVVKRRRINLMCLCPLSRHDETHVTIMKKKGGGDMVVVQHEGRLKAFDL